LIGPGGIDSSSSSTRNPAETAPHPPLVEDSDDEIERLFGKDDEDNNDTPSASKEPHGSNRREKKAAYLKDQQEKKMTPKLNIEKQHLSLFKGQWQRKFLLAISILLDNLTMKILLFPSRTF
jgi:hypothetical protein